MTQDDSTQSAVVDWQTARNLTGGDEALLDELVDLFPVEGAKHLAEIRQAIRSSNAELLVRAAHTLKSSAKLFGAGRVTSCAATIERLGRSAQLNEAKALMPELESEVSRLLATLKGPRPPSGEAS